jgi:hypothetical protein
VSREEDRTLRSSPTSPTSLVRAGGRAASYIEAANRALEPGRSEEARAWARLESRRARPRRLGLGAIAAVAGLAAVAFVVAAGLSAHWRGGSPPGEVAQRTEAAPPRAPAPVVVPVTPPRAPAPVASDQPGERPGEDGAADAAPAPAPSPLRPGRAVIAAGVSARLSARGVAQLFPPSAGPARIALVEGRLDVDARAAEPAPVEVSVAALRIEGQGSQFRVRVEGDKVDVQVSGGRVTVWSSRRLVARVVAGQRWSSAAPARGAAAPAPPPAEAPPAEDADGRGCDGLKLAGRFDEALACYDRQAARPNLDGEMALLEIARIRREVKGDLPGAERALAELRRRFPSGSFASEAGALHVEVLLRLGRAADALAEASRLDGPEAGYYRGLALARLGRADEARRAFDDYLARADGTHRAEARKRRAELGP